MSKLTHDERAFLDGMAEKAATTIETLFERMWADLEAGYRESIALAGRADVPAGEHYEPILARLALWRGLAAMHGRNAIALAAIGFDAYALSVRSLLLEIDARIAEIRARQDLLREQAMKADEALQDAVDQAWRETLHRMADLRRDTLARLRTFYL